MKRTPLYSLHIEQGARMVPFAGYEMPVQYEGIIAEHNHTRSAAGLFDVSHMGQIKLTGNNVAQHLEKLVPGDIAGLKPNAIRYTLLLDAKGHILDDLMVTRLDDNSLFLVVNAARKEEDLAYLKAHLPSDITIDFLQDKALLALQGPSAASVLERFMPVSSMMAFMTMQTADIKGIPVLVSRSGYTGEDGYEISVANDQAEKLARLLLAEPEVKWVGLGARDTLRLEAGLCLYGHDMDETINPVEANLTWTIPRRRRESADFPGADIILKQLSEGAAKVRVGIQPEGSAPAREGTKIMDDAGNEIGRITSGTFSPTLGTPIAMGYVAKDYAAKGQPLNLEVRGKAIPAHVAALPFVPHHYYRGS